MPSLVLPGEGESRGKAMLASHFRETLRTTRNAIQPQFVKVGLFSLGAML